MSAWPSEVGRYDKSSAQTDTRAAETAVSGVGKLGNHHVSEKVEHERVMYVCGLNTWMTKKSIYCATVEMVYVDPGECLNIEYSHETKVPWYIQDSTVTWTKKKGITE